MVAINYRCIRGKGIAGAVLHDLSATITASKSWTPLERSLRFKCSATAGSWPSPSNPDDSDSRFCPGKSNNRTSATLVSALDNIISIWLSAQLLFSSQRKSRFLHLCMLNLMQTLRLAQRAGPRKSSRAGQEIFGSSVGFQSRMDLTITRR